MLLIPSFKKLLTSFVFSALFLLSSQPVLANTIFTDSFTGTTINTTNWKEIDPTGLGGTVGDVKQNNVLTVGRSNQSGIGSSALVTVPSYETTQLEISANITPGGNAVIGFGDPTYTGAGQAYVMYFSAGSVRGLLWNNGLQKNTYCGAATKGALYKMVVLIDGFEIYKNNILLCKVTPTAEQLINNKNIFLQSDNLPSTFDNLSIVGAATTTAHTKLPGQITRIVTTPGQNQILLSWPAPDPGSTHITDYLIEYRPVGTETWLSFGDEVSAKTKAKLIGLSNDVSYEVRIAAVSSLGTGTFSDVATVRPIKIPHLTFVFTGESNSGGQASNTKATPAELASTSAVRILNNLNFTFEDLDVGTNNLVDHFGLNSTRHGFEIGLANAIKENKIPGHPQVDLVKTGQGGSRLSQWNVGGTYWEKFLKRTGAVKQTSKQQKPKPTQYVVWMSLGINDFVTGTPVATYKSGMLAHIQKIKAELPGAIIIMTQFQGMTANSGYPQYNAAMAEIAETEPNVFVVDTKGALLDNSNHFSYLGYKDVANRMLVVTKSALGL